MSESKLFENPFVVVCVWKFLMQRGVGLTYIQTFCGTFFLSLDQIPNILRNLYFFCLEVIQEIFGMVTKTQTFEEL